MIKKYSMFQRLVIANALYSIPVMALIYLMFQSQNVNIDFSIQEKKGNEIQRPLEVALKGLVELRGSMNSENQDEHFGAVTSAIKELEPVFGKLTADLQFDEQGLKKRGREGVKFETFGKKWADFVSQYPKSNPQQRSEALTALIGDVRTMIVHAGDTSNLILDPDLDSYYLMDVTLVALPQTQDRISEIREFLMNQLDKKMTQDELTKIAVFSALLKLSDLDRVTADIQTTLNEDSNFYGESPGLKAKLMPAVTIYQKSTEELVNYLNLVSKGQALAKTEIEAHTGLALKESFNVWQIAVSELDILLNKRIDTLTYVKYRDLSFALLGLLMAVSILFWISSSFSRNMHTVIENLKSATDRTLHSGTDMVNLSESLANASNEQSLALQETSGALYEITSMIDLTVQNTKTAQIVATETLERSSQVQTSINKMSDAIDNISQANNRVVSQIEANKKDMAGITDIISEIGNQTKIINDIVFQTKLLSFNASVEAARAGEAGKGFSVVAEEVGNLAAMSGSASTEISSKLSQSVTKVNEIAQKSSAGLSTLVSQNKDSVESGVELAEKCIRDIGIALEKVGEVLQNMEGIQRAASEQSKGISEINKAVQKLDEVSKKNTTMSQMTAEHSQEITRQAEGLREIVKMVRDEVQGQSEF